MKDKETIMTIAKWHEETFPDATLEDQLLKFEEEYDEWKEAQNLLELADMFIVACGVARFDGREAMHCFWRIEKCLHQTKRMSLDHLIRDCVIKKMKINRNRVWKKQDNGTYHHTNIED